VITITRALSPSSSMMKHKLNGILVIIISNFINNEANGTVRCKIRGGGGSGLISIDRYFVKNHLLEIVSKDHSDATFT
jgi:hypothetical protein